MQIHFRQQGALLLTLEQLPSLPRTGERVDLVLPDGTFTSFTVSHVIFELGVHPCEHTEATNYLLGDPQVHVMLHHAGAPSVTVSRTGAGNMLASNKGAPRDA